MKEFLSKILKVDRRIIFLLVAAVVIIPIYHPFNFPGLTIGDEVKSVYDTIESLPPRSVLLVSFDFDPASEPELYPVGQSILRHAFRKDLRVLVVGLWQTGIGLAEEITARAAKEYNKKDGEDYVFLGWKPNPVNVIIGLCQDLYKTYPKDFRGKPTRGMPVLKGVSSLKDINYMVDMAAGFPGVEAWYTYGRDKYKDKFQMGGACTAVSAPGLYTYLDSNQINGLIGGMRGAAEYEALLGQKDFATPGMDVQSTTHFLIILLVILCNILFVLTKPKKE